jgi:hypothetical protein
MAAWRRPIRVSAALVVCAAALASPSVAAADTSFPAAAGDLAAQGRVLVWSPGPLAPPGPLMAGFGSAAAPLPGPTAGLGGIDAGTDARGRAVLVYSACETKAIRCRDLYVYNFASGSTRRLASLSRSNCAEDSPEISRGTIVFVRSRCRPRSGAGLFIKRPGRPLRRLTELPNPAEEVLQHRGVDSFDLAGRTIAFIERRVGNELPVGSTWPVVTEVRTLRLGKRHTRLLARAHKLESRTSTGTSLGQVSLDGGFVYWTRSVFGSCDPDLPDRQDILRRPIDGSEPAAVLERIERLYAQPECDALGSYTVTGGQLYYSFNDLDLRAPDASTWPPNAIARASAPLVFR